ncbi:unnamed protein product [Dovyalis caffra]|uniref:Uncharacterized protein n=1 Tax=Dovyalis caffra TaxID=77055 RepID=A0AAV1RWQ7_9ROSI|nr:unnamed protein product [Dovyalis caffra]
MATHSSWKEIELPTSTSSDGGSTIRTNPCDGQMSHLKEKKRKFVARLLKMGLVKRLETGSLISMFGVE